MLIIVVIVAGATAFLWYRYLGSRPAEPVTRTNGQAAGSRELLTLLATLEGLKFDVSFFDDRLYKSLQDFSPEIAVPEAHGAVNPFTSP